MTITELKQKIQEITDEISELSLDDFAELSKELYELDDVITEKTYEVRFLSFTSRVAPVGSRQSQQCMAIASLVPRAALQLGSIPRMCRFVSGRELIRFKSDRKDKSLVQW